MSSRLSFLLAVASVVAPVGLMASEGARLVSLENAALSADWSVVHGVLRPGRLHDRLNGRTVNLGQEAFTLTLKGLDETKPEALTVVPASSFQVASVRAEVLAADPGARIAAQRLPGKALVVEFLDHPMGLGATWRAEIREGTTHVRQTLTLKAVDADLGLTETRMLDLELPGAMVSGEVQGSPVVSPTFFAGIEHPMSEHKVQGGRTLGFLPRKVRLMSRTSLQVSSVLGVTLPGQMRRTFLQYVEAERARPYQPNLNYNTWYDLGYFTRYNEPEVLSTVRTFGEELVKKRGVKMDSFLFDDGWDNQKTLWQFHAGLPRGLKEARKVAESYGATPGIWFSPWGGYGEPKEARVKEGKAAGYEVISTFDKETQQTESKFALSGPKYYARFHDMCMAMIKEQGVTHFKLDGTGNAGAVVPGSKFGDDFDAAIALIEDLRKAKPEVYINLTTGTWPSPFWTRFADSIWRDGYDHAFLGVGTQRQRWITYRDAMTYRYNVQRGPLYPLNSLMLHGVIYNKHAHGLTTDPGNDLPAEIWSAFACGTQMQELYLTPSMLNATQWDTLAAAAKWARAKAPVLVDTHWVGGDPGKLEVYGWAAWTPQQGILTLRNPSDQPQTLTLDVASAFELPVGAPTTYRLSSPVSGTVLPFQNVQAGRPASFTLPAFGLLVLEAHPQP